MKWRPDVIFIKGGYVCLPVGYAARLLRIPLVLHDSDAHPGLTNRLLSPFAKLSARVRRLNITIIHRKKLHMLVFQLRQNSIHILRLRGKN